MMTFVVEHPGLAATILAAQGGGGIAVRARVVEGSWDVYFVTVQGIFLSTTCLYGELGKEEALLPLK